MAIRDAVNSRNRKPFYWGGLAGYQQLEAIDQALKRMMEACPENDYFRQLSLQISRALDKNRTLGLKVDDNVAGRGESANCKHSFSRRVVQQHEIIIRQNTGKEVTHQFLITRLKHFFDRC